MCTNCAASQSANYVRQELPVRLAHRIRDLQALPFVVMTNKHLGEVYNVSGRDGGSAEEKWRPSVLTGRCCPRRGRNTGMLSRREC